jgi:membrane-bound inhibitor of C-type lysozyme
MMKAVAVIAMALVPGLAQAEMTVQNQRYLCARGGEVPVVYVADPEQAIAVVAVDGGQFLLFQEESASGARYGWPSDGSHYVWWTKGDSATLLWRDETGAETPILTDCAVRN